MYSYGLAWGLENRNKDARERVVSEKVDEYIVVFLFDLVQIQIELLKLITDL